MHHANLIISKKHCKDSVFDILAKELNFNVVGNPDFLLVEKESFGIDDARDLGQWAIGKPLSSETKVYFMVTKSISHEAQNALLKVFEEPSLGTYIFVNLESLGGILPTFLSRVQILDLENEEKKTEKHINAGRFLSGDIKERLKIARLFFNKENKNEAKELIKDLEEIAYQNKSKHEDMKKILTAKVFASARGSSPKMLLEWLSCVI